MWLPPRRPPWVNPALHRSSRAGSLAQHISYWVLLGPTSPAETTHVLFNNRYRDHAQINAQQLASMFRDLEMVG
jgi:hypothetical protein